MNGRRIGSGGSTVDCLRQVPAKERSASPLLSVQEILSHLRILILHAGGDSRRAARAVADTMERRDIAAFGACVDAAWALQKRLCKTVTNPAVESLLERVRVYVHAMRISGASSGGFLLMVCKSAPDAERVRSLLENVPLNERSRFFEFEVNHVGVEVTTC